jgi:hypothetical protein
MSRRRGKNVPGDRPCGTDKQTDKFKKEQDGHKRTYSVDTETEGIRKSKIILRIKDYRQKGIKNRRQKVRNRLVDYIRQKD